MGKAKKVEQIGVKVTEEIDASMKRIADAKNTSAADLLRRAAVAIVAYADVHGDKRVPLDDLEIIRRSERETSSGETLPFDPKYFLMAGADVIAAEFILKRRALIDEYEKRMQTATGVTDLSKSLAEQPKSRGPKAP